MNAMQFSKAVIAFDEDDFDDAPDKLPHSNVEIRDNGWVSADVVDEGTGKETTAYYSPSKVHAVFPE